MQKINLLGVKRQNAKVKNGVVIAIYTVMGGLLLFFVGQTIYVVVNTMLLNNELKKIDQESVFVSSQLLKSNQVLAESVLVKQIADKYSEVKSKQFPYKNYLDKINTYVPAGGSLTSVDFAEKGLVKISIDFNNSLTFKVFEDMVKDEEVMSNDQYFGSVAVESLNRNESGRVQAKIIFALK